MSSRSRARPTRHVWILLPALLFIAVAATAGPAGGASRGSDPNVRIAALRTEGSFTKGVILDPADYLTAETDASALIRRLVGRLAQAGVNTIYLNAYNVQYGAYYKTSYRFNTESEFGRQDFLGKLLTAAHARNLRVVAALYDHQHRGAWEAMPGWREKTKNGRDYNPPLTDIQYFLSVGNPGSRTWWMGFLSDLLRRYPDLDGIELREPIINWWGTSADWNSAVTQAFQRNYPGRALGGEEWRLFRRRTLTRFLKDEIGLIHRAGRFVHVTTVADAYGSGLLLPSQDEARETGFDLDALLSGPVHPDAIKVELVWQQWARVYDYVTFTPEWTARAASSFLEQVAGRVPVIVHVELTDFGNRIVSVDEFRRSLAAARVPGVGGLDFYSAFLADRKAAWPAIHSVFHPEGGSGPKIPGDKRALILYDEGKNDSISEFNRLNAIFLANLLGHFQVKSELHPVERYERGELLQYSYVFYQGTVRGNAPLAFVSDASVFGGTVVWIGKNLSELRESGVQLPFFQQSQNEVTDFTGVLYKEQLIPAQGNLILTGAKRGAKVLAWATNGEHKVPYVLRAGRFWYVAGSPFSSIDLDRVNGRYLAFADLLHDMMGFQHAEQHLTFIRVEDVNALTDPRLLRGIADAFASRDVPFMVGVIPFYVDPATNTSLALSDRPEVVRALQYMVRKGGALILHGSTHQYTGRTGLDYEFWDPQALTGVAEDGEPYVRGRIERALREMWATDLHPIAWETPHYSATSFDFALFADYFSTFVERRIYGVSSGDDYQQAMPFVVDSDVYGGRIVPENLGFVRGPGDPARMVDNARSLLTVRDGVAGGFIHVNVPPVQIVWLVDRIKELGYSFLDLYDVPNVVHTTNRVEVTGTGQVSMVVPTGNLLAERLIGRNGGIVETNVKRYRTYAHPTFTTDQVAGGGILSLLSGTDEQLRKALAPFAPLKIPPKVDPLTFFGRILAVGTAGLAALGVALILFAYLLVKLWLRQSWDLVPITTRLFTAEPGSFRNGNGPLATNRPSGDGMSRYWAGDGHPEVSEDAMARILAMKRDRSAAAARVQALNDIEPRPKHRGIVRTSLLASPAASIWPRLLGPTMSRESRPRDSRGKRKRG